MPKAAKEAPVPFVEVEDSADLRSDPTNSRVIQLFDALRKRGVGPERAAYCVSQVHGNSSGHAFPLPVKIVAQS